MILILIMIVIIILHYSTAASSAGPLRRDNVTLTFDPNLISSSLSQDAPVTKIWRKSINGYWRYRGNIIVSVGCTDGLKHGQRRAKHTLQSLLCRRRRLKNRFCYAVRNYNEVDDGKIRNCSPAYNV